MTDQNQEIDWESMFAALHANTAFTESIKHLQAITGAEKDSFNQAINRIAWTLVYIVALYGNRINKRLDNGCSQRASAKGCQHLCAGGCSR